jgi:hypothetical protein
LKYLYQVFAQILPFTFRQQTSTVRRREVVSEMENVPALLYRQSFPELLRNKRILNGVILNQNCFFL